MCPLSDPLRDIKITIPFKRLSIFSEYTGLDLNSKKCCVTGALLRIGNVVSKANWAFLEHRLSHLTVDGNKVPTPLATISPAENCKVLGGDLNTSLSPYR
jgi:hypothetical protein